MHNPRIYHHASHLQSLNFTSVGSTTDGTGWYGSGCSPQPILTNNIMDPTDTGRTTTQRIYSDVSIRCDSQQSCRPAVVLDDDDDADGEYDGDDMNADDLDSCSAGGGDEDDDEEEEDHSHGPARRGPINRGTAA
ncbi:hypothetical protein FGIG_09727 [Fasciola gigantica]|uniref:Uncharacterized protein n=1 Tax=Fasciola gigantica TaxID=46835 RepID=A0A504YAK0_FASGI|nr:hypothetical protein FGIG_09727 [Fasciola gigantica]